MASKTTRKKKTTGTTRRKKQNTAGTGLKDEVFILLSLAVCTILLISNFGIGGFVGSKIPLFYLNLRFLRICSSDLLLQGGLSHFNRGNVVKAYINQHLY